MRRVRILEDAAEEAIEAAAWYETQQTGLGTDFQEALEAALGLFEDEIVPRTSMPSVAGRRSAKRLLLRRFPYSVVVIERPENML